MTAEDQRCWEQALDVQERAALLAAWSRNEICPSGGLFRMATGGFRTSGRIEPFLSHVLGTHDDAQDVLIHLLNAHPDDAPWVLAHLSRHAMDAARERSGIGSLGAPVQAKQMIAAMLDYSVALGAVVEQLNQDLIRQIQANACIPAIDQEKPTDAMITWLADCAMLAAGDAPNIRSGTAPGELVRLLLESIRLGRLQNTLCAVPVEPEPPSASGGEWLSVAVGELDQIEPELVALAGVTDLWYETGLFEQVSFMEDVLEHTSAFVDEDRDDENQLPSHSWVTYEVQVRDKPSFLAELRARIEQLAGDAGVSLVEESRDSD